MPKIDVLKASSTQDYLIGHGERISMDPQLGTANDVELKLKRRVVGIGAGTGLGVRIGSIRGRFRLRVPHRQADR